MPRIFGSNVRPDLPHKYGTDGSAKYEASAKQQSAIHGHPQHGPLQQEQKQQRNLLLRRKLQQQQQQQQQQYAAASNDGGGPAFESSADASNPSNDPRADPDYYDYYNDLDEAAAAAAALRRQQLLNQLRKRQGGAAASGTRVVNRRPVGGLAGATRDYDDDYGLDGGMAGVGTSAVGASAAGGGGLIDRHGYGPQKRAYSLVYLWCIQCTHDIGCTEDGLIN